MNGQVEDVRILQEMPAQPVQQLKTSTAGDTIILPIVDDFSGKSTLPNPKFWSDNNVFINSTIPTGLLSIGAATFDGTNQYGFPYNINYNGSDSLADVLTSRYIRYVTNPSNVFLSFMYQAGGLGELPELEDSLVVEFWAAQDSAWEQVWAVKGNSQVTNFKSAVIPVDSAKYLMDGFRFRFAAYGARNGSFDVWNIDYVQLDKNRTPGDTVIIEPAFVRNHPYLSKPFTHIPWFHYQDNQIQDSITLTYRRNGPPPPGGWALNLGRYVIDKDGTQVKDRLNVPVITNLNHNVDIDFQVPIKPFSIGAQNQEFDLFMRSWFDGTAEGLRNNDTIEVTIPFKNDYAFDDGSAERGYGILNQANARVVFQFNPLQPDSLRGLYINFAHVGTDATQNTFRIIVWEDANGEPGLPIYISDSLYRPEYAYYHNGFMPFDLDTTIWISGAVYIGMLQTNADAIHVGLDLNTTDATKKFYGSGFTWLESLVPGTLMIRPYFKYKPLNFGIEDNPFAKDVFTVYPNPAADRITIKHDLNKTVYWQLLNSVGQTIEQGTDTEIRTGHLPRGLYILSISAGDIHQTEKIILQ